MNSNIPECIIDDIGTFKYIQILITNKSDTTDKKVIIRGTDNFSYHKEIFRDFLNKILCGPKSISDTYTFNPIGGGKIYRTPTEIKVYGYSSAYGQCDHKLTCDILKTHIPPNITLSYSFGEY